MTQYLPPNLLALFSARPPIAFKPPVDKLKKKKNAKPYIGVSDFISAFEDQPPALATRGEYREEKDERRKKEREVTTKIGLEEKLASWDPHTDPNASGDPFKTLFVGRINYDTSETKLRRELEAYGPVRRIQMVYNMRSRKPRGYAFVEFEHEKDMHSAYKHADGKKIDGRRILVDVERGRTVKSWRPRRLGGGLGGTRIGGPDDNIRHSGRVEQWERERGKEKERKPRSRSPRDRSERRGGDREKPREGGDREKPREDKPREDKPREDKPREDKPRDDKPRDDKPRDDKPSRDSSRTRERGDRDKDRKRERGGGEDKDRERPKRSRDDEKKEEPADEKKDRRDRDRSGRDRDGGRDRDRRDRGDRGKERSDRDGKDAREEPAEEPAAGGDGAENHVVDTNGNGQQEAMESSNGDDAY